MNSVSDPETELRFVKEYWLRTILPHIEGRVLRGVEFFVAKHVHWQLQKAVDKAGVQLAASLGVDLSAENFRELVMPEMLFADNVKPETLAAIAAPVVRKDAKLTSVDAIRNAHDLLMAAERYIGTLPKKKDEADSWHSDLKMTFSTVTFKEIETSNQGTAGQLPLLPPIAQKKKGRPEREFSEKPLSVPAIKAAVKRFLIEHTPRMTQQEYEFEQEQTESLAKAGRLVMMGTGKARTFQEWQSDNQGAIDDCLRNNRISLQELCSMRWERFKNHWQAQQNRVLAREAKQNAAAKAKEPKTTVPMTAATSPLVAGKRQT